MTEVLGDFIRALRTADVRVSTSESNSSGVLVAVFGATTGAFCVAVISSSPGLTRQGREGGGNFSVVAFALAASVEPCAAGESGVALQSVADVPAGL